MADEAVIIELLGDAGNPVRYTVADGTAIAKGALLQITDPRTASVSADGKAFAGIAATEKVVSDGQVSLALYTCGIFDLKDAGAGVTVGGRVDLGGINEVSQVDAAALLYSDVGIAMETLGAAGTGAILIGCGF